MPARLPAATRLWHLACGAAVTAGGHGAAASVLTAHLCKGKEQTMYPPHDEMARAYLAALRQEAAEHRMAEQVSTARQAPPQPRAATLLAWGIGQLARLRAVVS